MTVTVNGEKQSLAKESLNIVELLKFKDIEMPDMVSVQLNGDILDRENFQSTKVSDGDEVEFLYFMGGGQ